MFNDTKKKTYSLLEEKHISEYNFKHKRLIAPIPVDSYIEMFPTLAVENYDLFCIQKIQQ